jgi:metal-responsive CopG/Arc/MetJ family transcriptional regulator
MTIRKKVDRSTAEFISKGGEVAVDKEKASHHNLLIRIPKPLLDKMDEELKERPWMNRTALIMEAVNIYTNRDKE